MHTTSRLMLALLISGSAPTWAEVDIPEGLVVDVRIYEARSPSPDFGRMDNLSFFISTDGAGVSEEQWLATIARQAPDAYLATLAFQTAAVVDGAASFSVEHRSRSLALRVDLSSFLGRGTFPATVQGDLKRGERTVEEFSKEIELRQGHTFVFSGRDLELSASDYISHFRDYEDREHRGEVYERMRDLSVFLIVALTPRLAEAEATAVQTVALPEDVELPELESPFDVLLVGTIVLEFDVAEDGQPVDVTVVRSSIPEVNPRLVGEASTWRFPEAAGKRARIELRLRAEPGSR